LVEGNVAQHNSRLPADRQAATSIAGAASEGPAVQRCVDGVTGIALIGLGLRLSLTDR